MEPDGWAVIGLDANFYATVPSEVETGTLLGRTATVRFIPMAWHWSYGDGTVTTRSTGGAAWSSLRVTDFDPTATSHVYRAKGEYVIDLDIRFGAQYRWAGGDWQRVVGTIDVRANRLTVRAGTAKTVLVGHDCLTNPSGPGC